MSHSCHTRGSERINFLNLCTETTFQSSLNLTFPDVKSFQTSWLFEAYPQGAALVSSPAAEREEEEDCTHSGMKHYCQAQHLWWSSPYDSLINKDAHLFWLRPLGWKHLEFCNDKGPILLDRERMRLDVCFNHYYITAGIGWAIWLA